MPKSYKGYYAGFVSRLIAFFADALFVAGAAAAATWFVQITAAMMQLRKFLAFSLGNIPGSNRLIDFLFSPVAAGAFIVLLIICYHVLFLVFVGQTPGKALMGLRVVAVSGKRITYGRALLRLAAYGISALPLYLGFLWLLVDDRRQAWHDKIAGTVVIYAWEARPDERFMIEHLRDVEDGILGNEQQAQ